MADEITTKKESALTAKSEVNSTDFLRLIGSNGVSYKNLVTDVARYIMENYAGTTLAGSAQTPKASIDALKATNDSQQTSINSLNGNLTGLITKQVFTPSDFTGNALESSFTITLRQGYTPYILGVKPNNYNAAHFISYWSQVNSSGVFYIEHNLNPNATVLEAYILWVPIE